MITKTNKLWLNIGIVATTIIIGGCSHSNGNAYDNSSADIESEETYETETDWRECPQWEVTDIKGSPAIQADFHSNQYGILRIAYSPEKGFRFGIYDDGLSSILKDGMMIGYITSGEEFAKLIIPDSNDGEYIYVNAPSLADALNSGDVEYLTIERMNDDCSRDDSVDYRWGIRLKPGELSKMTDGL